MDVQRGFRRGVSSGFVLLFVLMPGVVGCGRERQFEVTSVTLERVAHGVASCDVIVKVLKHGNAVSGVTVQGQVKQFDLGNTTSTFDASDFGGPAEIGSGQEKTFIGRSVTMPVGVLAAYTIEVFHDDKRVVARGTNEPPIACPA
jgi:hypothetical protein